MPKGANKPLIISAAPVTPSANAYKFILQYARMRNVWRAKKGHCGNMIFNRRTDYNAIFPSVEETRKHIYGDPAGTADIIFGEEFLSALNNSPHQQKVEMIIRQKAIEGNQPSIMYMINLLGMFYAELMQNGIDQARGRQISKSILNDRILFCSKAVDLGLLDQAYYAMASSVALHSVAIAEGPETELNITQILDDIVKYGDIFLSSGYEDGELIAEVKSSLDYWRPLAHVMSQVSSS